MSYIQIVEYTTDRHPEIMAAAAGQLREAVERGWPRIAVTQDRDQPDRYLYVVEFPSYEQAMANSGSESTQTFARTMSELCTSGPTFRNLDVEQIVP